MAERQRLERAAQRAEHLALLGRLAAGVSHEIRNPLAAVFLQVDLLGEELRQPTPDGPATVAESLTEIKTNLAAIADLVQDYLSLVRVGTIQREVQDLGAAVRAWGAEFQAEAAARAWCSGWRASPPGADGVARQHPAPRPSQPGAQRPRRHAPGRHGDAAQGVRARPPTCS